MGALRSGRVRHAILVPALVAFVLAFCMEALQSYLPARVPSREDLLLDTFGACFGALSTVVLAQLGAIDRWSQIRARWFVPIRVAALCCWLCGPCRCCFRLLYRLVWGRCWNDWKMLWVRNWWTLRFWSGCPCEKLSCSPWSRVPRWSA